MRNSTGSFDDKRQTHILPATLLHSSHNDRKLPIGNGSNTQRSAIDSKRSQRLIISIGDRITYRGFLIVEVGDGLDAVEALFPGLELTWLSVSGGADQVFMVTQEALLAYFA